jgi:hypothetical protein
MNLHTPTPMTAVPPHNYVPRGPIDFPVHEGFTPGCVRQDAFAAVLDGVELGEYDRRMITWLIEVGDDPMCRAFASLMWRCRVVGVTTPVGGGEV